ncbi:MAG: AAA family ATPase, partial [bacterium]
MYLKRLELSGFKTFADRTDLEFVPGITAIVGPNGSGKSNLSDAIRWALGEQRSHTLRGTKTEDFIFAGSAKRRAHGLGQVGLVLDNTDGTLPLEYSDIGVLRRATRGGDGEFFLNGLPCRLRDIQLLFLGTGLGGRSYALIGQGEVEAVLNASPQERRLLLEEAAGLARYKRRRHESLRKLEHADAHLQRIRDLLTELQGWHAHLAEQAEAARQHRDYLQEIGSLEHALLADEARRLRGAAQRSAAQTELARARLGELAEAAEEARREAESLARRREDLTRGWEAHQRRLLDVVREQAAAAAAAERGQGRLAVHHHEEARLAAEADALRDDLDRLSADLTDVVAERQGAEGEAAALQDELGEILAILETDGHRRAREGHFSEGPTGETHPSRRVRALGEALDRAAAALGAAVERLRMLEGQRAALDAEQRTAEGRRHRLESRLQALKESTAQFAGYEEGARSLLLAQRGSPDLHRGILGALVDQIDVEPAYRPAVEAALGRRLFCLLTRGVGDVREALAAVRSNGRGPVSFLPLDRLAAHHQSSAVPEGDGLLGLAAAFVSAHGEASRAVEALLRDVIIVADLDRGLALIASGHRGRAVTLAGELLSPDGVVTVRGARNGERSPLSRRGDIDAAQRDLTEVKGTLEGFRDRTQVLQREIQGAEEETRRAQQAHQATLDRLRGQVDAARLRLAGLEATRRGLAARQGDFDGRRAAIAARREQILA